MITAPGTTIIDQIVPSQPTQTSNLVKDALLVLGFSIFLALVAQISIPLPFTPVPITGQTLGVLLIGATLGSRRGALTLLVYLVEGIAGLPVFALGTAGLPILLGPTGGYLVAFPVAAFVVGLLCELGLERRYLTSVLAMLPGSIIIFALGTLGLIRFLHVGVEKALKLGVFPFIPGDIIKIVLAAALLPTAWYIVRRWHPDADIARKRDR